MVKFVSLALVSALALTPEALSIKSNKSNNIVSRQKRATAYASCTEWDTAVTGVKDTHFTTADKEKVTFDDNAGTCTAVEATKGDNTVQNASKTFEDVCTAGAEYALEITNLIADAEFTNTKSNMYMFDATNVAKCNAISDLCAPFDYIMKDLKSTYSLDTSDSGNHEIKKGICSSKTGADTTQKENCDKYNAEFNFQFQNKDLTGTASLKDDNTCSFSALSLTTTTPKELCEIANDKLDATQKYYMETYADTKEKIEFSAVDGKCAGKTDDDKNDASVTSYCDSYNEGMEDSQKDYTKLELGDLVKQSVMFGPDGKCNGAGELAMSLFLVLAAYFM